MRLSSLFNLSAAAPYSGFPAVVPFMGANDSPGRTSTAMMPLDTRREITYFTRTQLVRKSRWLYNNMGLVRRLVNGVARYSVGTGISHIPLTLNEDFNKRADKYFDLWASTPQLCDVRRKLTFWQMQRHILRGMFRDGDSFALKAPAPDEQVTSLKLRLGRPRLQWLEAQTIGNLGSTLYDLDPQGYREGVLNDAYGAALSYRLLEDNGQLVVSGAQAIVPRIVGQPDLLHIYDCDRATQVRGIPWMAHGENSALDILDITALEKHATKLHAAVAAAIKKRSGDAGKSGFTGDLVKEAGKTASGKTRVIAFENFAGGAGILQLALDEEFQLFTSNRPSTTFAGFIEYLIRDIAWGFGVSPEFIWTTMGLNGPDRRGVLEDAKWFFEEIQDLVVNSFCQPVYMWVIARGIERGELVPPADVENPYECVWQGPAKLTIDQGKEGTLELERLKNGCGTWDEYWAARGKNGKRMVRRRIDELAEAMEYAAGKKGAGHEQGVPFDYVIALNKGGDGGPSGQPGGPNSGDPNLPPSSGG